MAEVNIESGGKKGRGRRRSSKSGTKIDMTPMVDLAFLLITFFMLTTTFNKPQAMDVSMPDKTEDNKTQDIKESKAMTIILGENNKIYYYIGIENPEVKVTDYSPEGIREVIKKRKAQIADLILIIKPSEKSKYKNMVDILDEIHLTDTKVRYAIAKITAKDQELIKNS
jgi:biopolymer transport protein ExbD